jgi:hypothetical protein
MQFADQVGQGQVTVGVRQQKEADCWKKKSGGIEGNFHAGIVNYEL